MAASDVILDGEDQARAAAQQLVLARVQLALQRLLRGAVAVGARPSVGGVAEREGQVAVAVKEVGVVIPQRLVVLRGMEGKHTGS